MNYVIYSVHQDSDMPRSNLVHIVLPVKFCSWWTFERETWKENYPFQTEKCHEIINNGSQKSTKLGFCGHVVFSFRKKEVVLKSESYTDKIFPHLIPQKILHHIQLYKGHKRPQKLTKSSPSIWHLLHTVKSTVKIFVAFLENTNFNTQPLWI